MIRSATLYSIALSTLAVGCVGKSAPSVDTGANNIQENGGQSGGGGTADDPDDTPSEEDSGSAEPEAPCRNLSVTPPSLLLECGL